ncbi:GATS protein-like 3 [Entomortierella beljakovae]|nr:GATS protein-like 3 [Entomortierella beljakovae]
MPPTEKNYRLKALRPRLQNLTLILPRHFFSYAETDKEVSLILDQSYVSGFPEGTLSVCNVVWRALQIEPGDSGLGSDEVIARVSKPLADNNVSIIPGSVTSLHDALLLDSTTQERRQSLDSDGATRPVSGTEFDIPNISSLSLSNTTKEDPSEQHGYQSIKPRHQYIANYPHRLHIASMEESLMDVLAIKLLESIFFDQRQASALILSERFFSFTRTDNSLSLIMDDVTMSLFPEHTLNTHEGDWRLISIGEGPLGFDECGIVSEFSLPLCDSKISLFYLSTFCSDYIMVSDEDFEQALACLCKTANVIDKDITGGSCSNCEDGGGSSSSGGGDGAVEGDGHNKDNSVLTEELFTSGSESHRGSESEPDSESLSEVDPEEEDESSGKGGGNIKKM